MSSLNILHGTKPGQRIWYCGLHAKFIDTEQISVKEMITLKRMPHPANLQAERKKEKKKKRKKGGGERGSTIQILAVIRPQKVKSCLRRKEFARIAVLRPQKVKSCLRRKEE